MEERRLLRNGAMGQSNAEFILLLIREGQKPGEWGLRSFFRGLSTTGIDKGYRRVCYSDLGRERLKVQEGQVRKILGRENESRARVRCKEQVWPQGQ